MNSSASAAATVDASTAAALPTAAAAPTAVATAESIVLEGYASDSDSDSVAAGPPRRLIRAEAILARRLTRLLLVVETLQDETNHQAILRTADSFGVQHVWIVRGGPV